ATKLDSHTPRGYALLLSEIDEGLKEWSNECIARFYQCSQCGLCREDCEFHWKEDDLVRHAREEIVAIGREPQNVKGIAESVSRTGTPFGHRKNESIGNVFKNQQNPDVLYFAGCSTHQFHPEVVQSLTGLLNYSGLSWTMLEPEICCGMPLFDLGYPTFAHQQAESVAQLLADRNPRLLVTGCPHCYRAFQEKYPEWGVSLPSSIQVMHSTEFIDQLMRERKIELKSKLALSRVCYHDPCQLGRKMGIYDFPRSIIHQVTGHSPIEIFHNREKAECCGAGSVLFFSDPGISTQVARVRWNRIQEENPQLIVTACQNCKTALQGVSSIDVLDISELIIQVLGGDQS
ncbi:MAG: (Fe-S)-binding protein, partial [Atribacterota bacterium]